MRWDALELKVRWKIKAAVLVINIKMIRTTRTEIGAEFTARQGTVLADRRRVCATSRRRGTRVDLLVKMLQLTAKFITMADSGVACVVAAPLLVQRRW
jgi:hypothetical protein